MGKLDVQHFLRTYQTRKKMQEDGVTNPSDEVKKFTREFVEKLLTMPLEEELKIEGNSFLDAKGKIIATTPFKRDKLK